MSDSDIEGETSPFNQAHRELIVQTLTGKPNPPTLFDLVKAVAAFEGLAGMPIPSSGTYYDVWTSTEAIVTDLADSGQVDRLPPRTPHADPKLAEAFGRFALRQSP